MKYVYLFLTLVMISLILVLGYSPKNGIKENMDRGELQYSTELGLINWGHARPEGTIDAFKRFQKLLKTATDTVVYAYDQKVVMHVGAVRVIVAYEEQRKVPPKLTVEEQKTVFFEIFTSVSTSFEDMQATFPMAILPGSRDSSYRPGDLMGNLISYYSAISGVSLETIKSQLTLWPTETGYQKYKDEVEGMTKPRHWQTTIGVRKNTTEILVALQKIIDVTQNKTDHISIKVSGEHKFYFR